MKSLSRTLIIFSITMLLLSCQRAADKNVVQNPATPKPLQDNAESSFSLKKYRGDDLVDEIYKYSQEKNPDLKKLEDDIEAYNGAEPDSLAKFYNYMRKPEAYYLSANNHIGNIKDSILQREMKRVVAESNARYLGKIAYINKMIEYLNKQGATLGDYRIVLKLLVTLPVIEQYQNDERPADKELDKLFKKKRELIERTKRLTPKSH